MFTWWWRTSEWGAHITQQRSKLTNLFNDSLFESFSNFACVFEWMVCVLASVYLPIKIIDTVDGMQHITQTVTVNFFLSLEFQFVVVGVLSLECFSFYVDLIVGDGRARQNTDGVAKKRAEKKTFTICDFQLRKIRIWFLKRVSTLRERSRYGGFISNDSSIGHANQFRFQHMKFIEIQNNNDHKMNSIEVKAHN